MSYFFALKLSEEARQFVQDEVVTLWKPALQEQAVWSASEDYHITLKFLGDVPEERQPELITEAKSVAEEVSPFAVMLAPPGSFPTQRPKRIFWMGVRKSQEINTLAAVLDRVCSRLEFQREVRAYTPHITVARYPQRRGSDTADTAETAPPMTERSFPSWQATQFVLMQTLPPESRAKDTKARYNIVHTFPLAGAQISDVS
jgi:2'-5' RNA ligase